MIEKKECPLCLNGTITFTEHDKPLRYGFYCNNIACGVMAMNFRKEEAVIDQYSQLAEIARERDLSIEEEKKAKEKTEALKDGE